jgi:hypothetical protein
LAVPRTAVLLTRSFFLQNAISGDEKAANR